MLSSAWLVINTRGSKVFANCIKEHQIKSFVLLYGARQTRHILNLGNVSTHSLPSSLFGKSNGD